MLPIYKYFLRIPSDENRDSYGSDYEAYDLLECDSVRVITFLFIHTIHTNLYHSITKSPAAKKLGHPITPDTGSESHHGLDKK
jgi:hypothetical protein